MPRIRFTNLFAERIGGINSVDVPAATVESALRALTDRHPNLGVTPFVTREFFSELSDRVWAVFDPEIDQMATGAKA